MGTKRGISQTGIKYSIPDPRRGSFCVDMELFAADREEFRAQFQELQKTPEYAACMNLYAAAKKAREQKRGEYDDIMRELYPAEMGLLRKARESLSAAVNAIEEIRTNLYKGSSEYEAGIDALKAQIVKNGPDNPLNDEVNCEIEEDAEALRLFKRRCSERLARLAKRKARAVSTISSLSQLKEDLLSQKTIEIHEAEEEMRRIKRLSAEVSSRIAGDVFEIPAKVIRLIKEDPSVGEETVRKILNLQPHYCRSHWDFNKQDPRGGSIGLIASCIGENKNQSMADLIVRVAYWRNCQFADAMVVLTDLRARGLLYYFKTYPDGSMGMAPWPNARAAKTGQRRKESLKTATC